MKKLLSLLSVLTISGTAVPTTIAASPYQKEETINSDINYSQTNNLEKLNRNKRELLCFNYDFRWFVETAIEIFYVSKNIRQPKISIEPTIERMENDWQKEFYNNKTGLLKITNKERLSLENSKVWGDTFNNVSDEQQNFVTQEYEKNITNTYTWNVSLSVKESLNFNFFVGEANVEFTTSAGYTKTKTESETLRLPSQNFKLKPNSIAYVEIILEKAKYKNTGILKFEESMSKQLDVGSYFPHIEGDKYITLSSLVNYIINSGRGTCIDLNNEETISKTFTVDNINNPNHAFFNIPINWEWYGNNLIVNFTN